MRRKCGECAAVCYKVQIETGGPAVRACYNGAHQPPLRSEVKRTPRRRRNAVTMHEVAKHAGVSPMTVSRALSGDAHVQENMRQRVQEAIQELGYHPNVSARNLARAATVHIGLLYNNPSAAYLNELLVGVLEQGSHAGCQI